MRKQFENYLLKNGYPANPCLERTADFPLRKEYSYLFSAKLPGSAMKDEKSRQICTAAANAFLDSDIALRAWTSSGCSKLAESVVFWGFLSNIARVKDEGRAEWCDSGDAFKTIQTGGFAERVPNCGAVLSETLVMNLLAKIGVRPEATTKSYAGIGWEEAALELRGLKRGWCVDGAV